MPKTQQPLQTMIDKNHFPHLSIKLHPELLQDNNPTIKGHTIDFTDKEFYLIRLLQAALSYQS